MQLNRTRAPMLIHIICVSNVKFQTRLHKITIVEWTDLNFQTQINSVIYRIQCPMVLDTKHPKLRALTFCQKSAGDAAISTLWFIHTFRAELSQDGVDDTRHQVVVYKKLTFFLLVNYLVLFDTNNRSKFNIARLWVMSHEPWGCGTNPIQVDRINSDKLIGLCYMVGLEWATSSLILGIDVSEIRNLTCCIELEHNLTLIESESKFEITNACDHLSVFSACESVASGLSMFTARTQHVKGETSKLLG